MKEENAFMGQIGCNVPMNEAEKEEDLLETLYLWWRNGKPLAVIDIAIELGMKKREVNNLLRRMVNHGYMEEPCVDNELQLTDFGKIQGAECLRRHQSLTQFLMLVSDMDQVQAQENACRMEHIIDKKGIQGISNFLKYGDVYDRLVHNMDLCTLYEIGSYYICMGIYLAEKRYPRILADEFDLFDDELNMEVGSDRSQFYLRLTDPKCPEVLWYRHENKWIKAERTEEGYRLPAEIFTFTISPKFPITEGIAMIAVLESDQTPDVSSCRELNVHLW